MVLFSLVSFWFVFGALDCTLSNFDQDLERRERAAKDEREGKVKDSVPMAVGGPWSFWVGIHSVLGSVGSVFLFCMSSLSAEEKKKPSLEDNPFPEAWNMKTKTQFETARNELVRFVPECVARVPVCVRSTLRLRSQPFATVRNRSQPSPTVRNRPLEGRMAVPMVSSAKGVIFGGFKRRVASFRVAGAILLRRFRKMSCSARRHFAWQAQHFRL